MGIIDDLDAKSAAQQEWEDSWGGEIALALRIGGPILGGLLAGPVGYAGGAFIGGGLGDLAAQYLESERGVREEINPLLTGLSAATAGIPGARLTVTAGRRIAREAAVGATSAGLMPVVEEGQLPGAGSLLAGAALGAGGGAIGAYLARLEKGVRTAALEQRDLPFGEVVPGSPEWVRRQNEARTIGQAAGGPQIHDRETGKVLNLREPPTTGMAGPYAGPTAEGKLGPAEFNIYGQRVDLQPGDLVGVAHPTRPGLKPGQHGSADGAIYDFTGKKIADKPAPPRPGGKHGFHAGPAQYEYYGPGAVDPRVVSHSPDYLKKLEEAQHADWLDIKTAGVPELRALPRRPGAAGVLEEIGPGSSRYRPGYEGPEGFIPTPRTFLSGVVSDADAAKATREGKTLMDLDLLDQLMTGMMREPTDYLLQNAPRGGWSGAHKPGSPRVSEILQTGLKSGLITTESLMDTLHRNGMPADIFAMRMVADEALDTASEAGRTLARFSTFKQSIRKLAEDREALAIVDPSNTKNIRLLNQLKVAQDAMDTPSNLWDFAMYGGSWGKMHPNFMGRSMDMLLPRWEGFVAVDNVRRKLMVAQLKTTVRNVMTQAPRYGTWIADEALRDMFGTKLGREQTGTAKQAWESLIGLSFVGRLTGKHATITKQLNSILSEHDSAGKTLFRRAYGEAIAGQGFTDWANTLNSMQENWFRKSAFHGKVSAWINKQVLKDKAKARALAKETGRPYAYGPSAEKYYRSPHLIPKAVVDDAVEEALRVTFQGTPSGGLGKTIMKMNEAFPPLSMVNPYPRFLANSWEFMVDHSPLAFTKITRNTKHKAVGSAVGDAEMKLSADEINENVRHKAQGAIGTFMLASAFAVDQLQGITGVKQGTKWYELDVDDDGLLGTGLADDSVLDFRAFAPFAQYLFFTKFVKGVLTLAEEDDYHALQANELLNPEKFGMEKVLDAAGMTMDDFAQGMISMRVPTALSGVLDTRSVKTQQGSMLRIAGEWLGGFTVPLRTVKDFYGGLVDAEELRLRDVRSRDLGKQFIGPALSNIPGLSRMMPESPRPTGQPAIREMAVQSQISGFNVRSRQPIEEALDYYGIPRSVMYIKESDPQLRRTATEFFGKFMQQKGVQQWLSDFLPTGEGHKRGDLPEAMRNGLNPLLARLSIDMLIRNAQSSAKMAAGRVHPELYAKGKFARSRKFKFLREASQFHGSAAAAEVRRFGKLVPNPRSTPDAPLDPQWALNGVLGDLFESNK